MINRSIAWGQKEPLAIVLASAATTLLHSLLAQSSRPPMSAQRQPTAEPAIEVGPAVSTGDNAAASNDAASRPAASSRSAIWVRNWLNCGTSNKRK